MNERNGGKTALVLCGGGSRGAAEVGFYKAIYELGIKIDMIVGTSVGAINGTGIACGFTPQELRHLWLSFPKWKPFRFNWQILWKGLNAQNLLDPTGLRNFLNDTLPVKRFESLKIPLTIVATDLQKAESIHFETGSLIFAIMASIALPLYFPPVFFNGHQIVDGAVTNDIPLDVAVKKGATKIYAMFCGCQAELDHPARGILNIQSQAFQIATMQKFCSQLEPLKEKAELVILEPCLTSVNGVLDFSQSAKIIDEAYKYAMSDLSPKIKERGGQIMKSLFGWLDKFGIAGALVALACCLGLPGIIAFLSAIGVGFLVNDAYLIPLLIVFLIIGAIGLFRSYHLHKKIQPFILYISGAMSILIFLLVRFNRQMLYLSAVVLIASSVWDMIAHKGHVHGS